MSHTWPIHHHYHRCPKCGAIIESRRDYVYRMGSYEKDLECDRCGEAFTERRDFSGRIGPLFGEASGPEFDWS